MNGDIYVLRTNSESIQVTIVGVSKESVQARIDDFELTVGSDSDGFRKSDDISVSRDYLWPQTSDGYLGNVKKISRGQ